MAANQFGQDLRGNDPDVLRVMGMIEGARGRATALDYYEKLSQKSELNADDLQARAEIATRFGNEEQFSEGIDALEKAGKAKEAGEWRAARRLRQLPWGRRGEEGSGHDRVRRAELNQPPIDSLKRLSREPLLVCLSVQRKQ